MIRLRTQRTSSLNPETFPMSSNQNSNAVVSSLALTEQARYFDYRMASNPLSGEGAIAPVTSPWFGSELHESGPTGIVTLDNSKSLGC